MLLHDPHQHLVFFYELFHADQVMDSEESSGYDEDLIYFSD